MGYPSRASSKQLLVLVEPMRYIYRLVNLASYMSIYVTAEGLA